MEADLSFHCAHRSFCWCFALMPSALSVTCKVPKFSDSRKRCGNQPKIHTKRTNLWVFCQKDANGIANSEDPDQTAPPGAVRS